jgi:NAD(P)H-dependent FMN reductase
VLAVSGSLRAVSSNRLAIQLAAALAPVEVELRVFEGLGELPHFNPDLDDEECRPAIVRAWRREVASADALLISSPEYAHGVPGSLKNGLDWLVSGPEFPNMPVALLNANPRATHAQAALAETVKTMSGELVEEASVAIPLSGRPFTLAAALADPEIAVLLGTAMQALLGAIGRARSEGRRLVPAEWR